MVLIRIRMRDGRRKAGIPLLKWLKRQHNLRFGSTEVKLRGLLRDGREEGAAATSGITKSAVAPYYGGVEVEAGHDTHHLAVIGNHNT